MSAPPDPLEIAVYIRDLTADLASMAEAAGLPALAQALREARAIAADSAAALQAPSGSDDPDIA